MRSGLISFSLVSMLSLGSVVAETGGESQEETLRKLIARVESLETEVRQLRAEKATASMASAPAERRDSKEMAPPPPSETAKIEEESHESFPQLKIRGF